MLAYIFADSVGVYVSVSRRSTKVVTAVQVRTEVEPSRYAVATADPLQGFLAGQCSPLESCVMCKQRESPKMCDKHAAV